MSDDKSEVKRDRMRVAAEQPYEVSYFMKKHGLARDEAETIIKQAGHDRKKADALAEKAGK